MMLIVGLLGTASGWVTAWERARELEAVVQSLREELIDRALNAAVSGDSRQAERGDRPSRNGRGAARDLLQTLHGLALFYAGKPDEAIRHLEHAITQDPKNASAWFVLYWAYDYSGRYNENAQVGHAIAQQRMDVRTDYDELFQAQADLTSTSKDTCHRKTQQASSKKHRNWLIAYAIRSRVWSDLATDTSQLDHIQNAINDANMAEKPTPGNPYCPRPLVSIAYNRGN